MIITQKISQIIDFILDLIFPKTCSGCGKENSYFCQVCLEKVPLIEKFCCPVCEKLSWLGKTCSSCQRKTYLTGLIYACSYKTSIVKEAIQALKYNYLQELAKPLTSLLIKLIRNSYFLSNFNEPISNYLIIPIPLYHKKFLWRGFNQAELITKELAKEFDLRSKNDLLIKIKDTASQVDLKGEKRLLNVKDVFQVKNKKIIRGKIIFLVDDVITTGATLNEAAKVFKKAGAKEIWGLAIAKG